MSRCDNLYIECGSDDMVIVMTNDSVSVYDMDNATFEAITTSEGLSSDKLKSSKVYEILKVGYTPEKLEQQLAGKLSNVHSYYYDNGSSLVCKEISSIAEVNYFTDRNGDLWPSEEYSLNINGHATLDIMQAQLVSLDNELNSRNHLQNVLSPDLIPYFKAYYDTPSFIQQKKSYIPHCDADYVLASFYEVQSFSKLIIRRKNNQKLSTSNLEENVFLTVTPVGEANGENIYCIEEYQITKKDATEIGKIYRRYLKDDGVKANDLSEQEKYVYYDRAVRQYRQNILGELEGVSSKERSVINPNVSTWHFYKSHFLSKYGYPVGDFDDTWALFEKTLIDARSVHNGYIVPITIEAYQRENVKKTADIEETKTDDNEGRFITEDVDNSDLGEDLFANPDVMEPSLDKEDVFTAPDVMGSSSDKEVTFTDPDVSEDSKTATLDNLFQAPEVYEEVITPKESSDLDKVIEEVELGAHSVDEILNRLSSAFALKISSEVFRVGADYSPELIAMAHRTLDEVTNLIKDFRMQEASLKKCKASKEEIPERLIYFKLRNLSNAFSYLLRRAANQEVKVNSLLEAIKPPVKKTEEVAFIPAATFATPWFYDGEDLVSGKEK